MTTQGHTTGCQPRVCGGSHLRVLTNPRAMAAQGYMHGCQPIVCGGYHLRIPFFWLPRATHLWWGPVRGIVWWFSPGDPFDYKILVSKDISKFWFRNDRINGLCKAANKLHQAKYHVDRIFTSATIYVSFASTSMYWPPLWGCIFKRAGCYRRVND